MSLIIDSVVRISDVQDHERGAFLVEVLMDGRPAAAQYFFTDVAFQCASDLVTSLKNRTCMFSNWFWEHVL